MNHRSKIRVGRLAGIFPFSGPDHGPSRFYAQLARLCVLHEDLRLEIIEIHEPPRSREFTHFAYRLYFWRRAIATLQEFSDALVHLDKQDSFDLIRNRLDPQELAIWNDAIKHFKSIKPQLEHVRNDIGGHFGLKAAMGALQRLAYAEQGESTGSIEDCELEGASPYFHVPLRLHFASDIAAAAMVETSKSRDWAGVENVLKQLWAESHQHAYQSVRLIVATHLWDRFGR